ncbi:prolyl aminopeptidase [Hyphobacterium sp. HN65]|uniref:Proline iminopeptidase n=1 Tax=Hyphobacterium lacteum TaxID=3116575 RepID=A0ABU7LTN8_9PROT|nr:prolyl aminopeptidase [Hyphobacterium sp. HN65]MEE2527220.1 prolyl aminopeptidase [Hyphobacterium sp. HN65]
MSLFPEIQPRETGFLETADGHRIYWERCGKAGGVPLVFLHGGPGSGCTPTHRRYFNPDVFDIVLFDQRGCGRSRPLFDIASNTTQHLIGDLEALRCLFGFERWIVGGASWGSTLSLAYAQTHPDVVAGLFVEGVFLSTGAELAWWHAVPGVPSLFPDAFADFLGNGNAPQAQKISDFFAASVADMQAELASGLSALRRIEDAATSIEDLRHSLLYRWTEYEERISWIEKKPEEARQSMAARGLDYIVSHSLIEAHYFANNCFLEDDQLLRNAGRMMDIPVEIIQSRYDVVCPVQAAWRLRTACPGSRLSIINANGHAMTNKVYPALQAALMRLAKSF